MYRRIFSLDEFTTLLIIKHDAFIVKNENST